MSDHGRRGEGVLGHQENDGIDHGSMRPPWTAGRPPHKGVDGRGLQPGAMPTALQMSPKDVPLGEAMCEARFVSEQEALERE